MPVIDGAINERLKEVDRSAIRRADIAEFEHRQEIAVTWAEQVMKAVGVEDPEVTIRRPDSEYEVRGESIVSNPIWIDKEREDPAQHWYTSLFARIHKRTISHHAFKNRLLRPKQEVATWPDDQQPKLYVVERHLAHSDDVEDTLWLGGPTPLLTEPYVKPRNWPQEPSEYEAKALLAFTCEMLAFADIAEVELTQPRHIH